MSFLTLYQVEYENGYLQADFRVTQDKFKDLGYKWSPAGPWVGLSCRLSSLSRVYALIVVPSSAALQMVRWQQALLILCIPPGDTQCGHPIPSIVSIPRVRRFFRDDSAYLLQGL